MSSPTPEDQGARITKLEELLGAALKRIDTLETALVANNQAVMGLQRNIVEITANHIDRIMTDPVMVDTLAQRFFIAGANAIAHKASKSKARAPQLVVIEAMIPGCTIKARLDEEANCLIQMLDKEGNWQSGDDLPEEVRTEQFKQIIGNLLLSNESVIGRDYFIVDDLTLEDFREQAAAQAKQALGTVQGAQEPKEEELPGVPVSDGGSAEEPVPAVTH